MSVSRIFALRGEHPMRRPKIAQSDREQERPATRRKGPLRVRVLTQGLNLVLMATVVAAAVWSKPSESETVAACENLAGTVVALAVRPDGPTVTACMSNGSLVHWEPGSGLSTSLAVNLIETRSSTAMAADGSAVVVEEREGSLKIRDGLTGHTRHQLDAAKVWRRRALAFQHDAGLVASADREGVDLWHAATGLRVGPRLALCGTICLAIAPDGRTLAVGDHEGMVRLCDPVGGRQLHVFRAHSTPVWSLAFSDDGRMLATAGDMDPIVRIWDPATGHRRAELDGRAPSQFLAFSPGGRALATAGMDGAVQIWDPATGRRLQVMRAGRGGISSVAFSPDARGVVCGGSGALWWHRVDVVPGR